jgi:hypothetical protein
MVLRNTWVGDWCSTRYRRGLGSDRRHLTTLTSPSSDRFSFSPTWDETFDILRGRFGTLRRPYTFLSISDYCLLAEIPVTPTQ